MNRNWIAALSLAGAFSLGGLSLAQEGSKNEEKKGDTPPVTIKATNKVILVSPDGKVLEQTISDKEEVVEGKQVTVTLSRVEGGEPQEIVILTPEGEKKSITLQKIGVAKALDGAAEGKKVETTKTFRVEAKVVDGEKGEKHAIIIGDGKSFDVKGVGVDVEKLKKLLEEKKGEVSPEQVLKLIKPAEGKPIGGAVKLQLKKLDGHDDIVVLGVDGKHAEAKASASSSSDISAKLDKILERLEKLEERVGKLEKND